MATRTERARSASAAPAPAAADTASGPRIPKRTEWIALPGAYGEAGMQALTWVNYPHRYLRGIATRESAQAIEEALRACVLEHNGWLDQNGEPLPDAQSESFWWSDEISSELVNVVLELLREVPRRYPLALRQNGVSSGST